MERDATLFFFKHQPSYYGTSFKRSSQDEKTFEEKVSMILQNQNGLNIPPENFKSHFETA